ncbi:MAG: SusD/RagB family nutrient-binding outer membrane lipoprotein [Bacteroidota bacterium]
MKLINRLFAVILVSAGLTITSCEFTELDLLDNPNDPTPDQAELEFLYNNIQLSFNGFYQGTLTAGRYARISHMGDFTYNASAPSTLGNGLWSSFYAGLFPDIQALIEIADAAGADIEKGSAKIMQAYAMFTLADLFGDIPFTEAGQGTDIISPASDPAESIYTTAIALLDEAIGDLTDTQAGAPTTEIFYDGDPTKWITLANTLKLRAYANTRLTDPNAASQINAIVSAGDIIDNASEDFTFKYGSQRLNPNSRHPWYNNAYEQNDAAYIPNYYMWLMVGEKGIPDPRTRFYFYRQISNSLNQEPNAYSCLYNEGPPDPAFYPAHYAAVDPNLPYCVAADNGYYGRDHGNGQGIPPDGPLRTVYGLYPAGGQFDNSSFEFTQNMGTDGALGQGISPVWLSSYTHFVLAEAALLGGASGDAKALLIEGITQSIAKARSFESFLNPNEVVGIEPGTNREITLKEQFLDPLADETTDYLDLIDINWDTAPDDDARMDIIAKEYLLALWGNGIEAYNMYRRTAKPANIQPTLDPSSGNFIQTFLYPADHVNRNASITQKSTDELPFWSNLDPSQFNR